MHIIEYYDNKIPEDIHKEAYDYIRTLDWDARRRHVPSTTVKPSESEYKNDLVPYVDKKTIYRACFGSGIEEVAMHPPIADLFNSINSTLFDNKFELTGIPIGEVPEEHYPEKEHDDFLLDQDHRGHRAYIQAQPYETVKRTRVPHSDWSPPTEWEVNPDDAGKYFTIVFV